LQRDYNSTTAVPNSKQNYFIMIKESEGLTFTNKGEERLMTKQENMNNEVNKNKQSVCAINYTYNIYNEEDNANNDMTGSVEVDMDETLFNTLYNENTELHSKYILNDDKTFVIEERKSSNLQYNEYQYDGFFNTLNNE
jgi:hypothetical protein